MIKRPMRFLATLTLLAVAGLAGCDSTPISPDATPAPSYSEQSWLSLVSTPTAATATSVTQVVGRQGGQIRVGGHSLLIPSRTVSEDTEFTFAVEGSNNIKVHLSARRVRDGRTVSTFSQPLTLRLSYEGADVSDPTRLKNVFLVDGTADGPKEVLRSSVSQLTKTVASPVVHFSIYAMAMD